MRALFSLFVAIALISSAFGASFEFSGNVTLNSNQENQFRFRSTSMGSFDLGLLSYRAWYQSGSIGDIGGGALSADLLHGEVFAGVGIMPCAYLAYFDHGAQIQPNLTINFNTSAAFIGGAFVGLEEVDPSGNVVRTVPFTGTLGIGTGITWSKFEEVGDPHGLSWATVKGAASGSDWSIYVTFILTSRVGIINKANTIVNPRSLESIIEIKGWEYQNPANKLVLKNAVATAAGDLDGTGKVITGTGQSMVYATLQTTAEVSGTSVAISITANVTSDWTALGAAADFLRERVEAKYGAQARVVFFDVAFPAGATNILWDPTLGQGEPLTGPANSAGTVQVAFFVTLLTVLFALLF